jgi:signal transduction histidine kinase
VILDRDAVVVRASAAAGHLYGCAPERLEGLPLARLVLQDVLDPDLRLSARRADGGEFPIEVSVKAFDLPSADARAAGWNGPFLAVGIRDVTQRRRRADALREAGERRRMQAAEDERARWARELHDETLQSLAALHVLLSSGVRAPTPEAMRERIGLAQEQIEDAMENLRGLINDLRPPSLDELGLEASVHDLAQRTEAAYGIDVAARVELHESDGAPRRLAAEVETTAYRIVQECLSNAARHAGATRIAVEIVQPGDQLRVRVRDDGCGFDAAARERAAGYGLRSMQERVELLEGELSVNAAAGSGTEITASLPLAR